MSTGAHYARVVGAEDAAVCWKIGWAGRTLLPAPAQAERRAEAMRRSRAPVLPQVAPDAPVMMSGVAGAAEQTVVRRAAVVEVGPDIRIHSPASRARANRKNCSSYHSHYQYIRNKNMVVAVSQNQSTDRRPCLKACSTLTLLILRKIDWLSADHFYFIMPLSADPYP